MPLRNSQSNRPGRLRSWMVRKYRKTMLQLNETSQENSQVFVGSHMKDKFSCHHFRKFVGPGFLVSIAYIDPGNLLTDIQAGVQFNYRLIWVLVFSTFLGLLLQIISSRLGLATQHHLAELCRHEYGHRTPLTYVLWVITEITIVCSDIPEVIGSAFGFKLLFSWPLWVGVIISSFSTIGLMTALYFGVRKLEMIIGVLVMVMAVCFFVETAMTTVQWTNPHCPAREQFCHFMNLTEGDCPRSYCGTVWGGYIPIIDGKMIFVAVSLIGAVVMPHNLYLHSGLVLSRGVNITDEIQMKWSMRYNQIESGICLLISCIINICVVLVGAGTFYPTNTEKLRIGPGSDHPDVDAIGFTDVGDLLGNLLGDSAKYLFGIALLASGLSSTVTGTYAGQFVMEGFLDLKVTKWKRNLLTRGLAIGPSLFAALVAGDGGANTAIIVSSMVLSFQLPFALIPLLRFTSSQMLMGKWVNGKLFIVISTMLAVVVCLANSYLVIAQFTAMGLKGGALAGCIVGLIIGFLGYYGFLGYLLKRKQRLQEAPSVLDLTSLYGEHADSVMDDDDALLIKGSDNSDGTDNDTDVELDAFKRSNHYNDANGSSDSDMTSPFG